METIKIKLLHPNAKMPQRASATAAAFDVAAVSRCTEGGYITYGLGISSELPPGWEAKLYARSSISSYDLVLCNSVGIVDCDYRGEWQMRFKLIDQVCKEGEQVEALPITVYEVGDRIGQVQFQRVPEVRLVQVDELQDSQRGSGGFGSTGK